MSDELKEQIENIWKYLPCDLGERIEELEKKFDSFSIQIPLYEVFRKEIAELKGNFDDHTHLVWFNKIKELEASSASHTEEFEHRAYMSDVNRTGVSNLFTNYGELKDQIIRAWEVIVHNKEECMENRIIKEVLRELIVIQWKFVNGFLGITEHDDESYYDELRNLLAKLSGSGGEKE